MAKKSKARRVKRVLGVRIPKPVGRFIATPAGRIAIAGALIAGGVAASRNPRVRAAAAMAAHEVQRAGRSAGQALGAGARAALAPMMAAAHLDGAGKKAKRKAKSTTPRLRQDDAERVSH